jgi:hypothetical protein
MPKLVVRLVGVLLVAVGVFATLYVRAPTDGQHQIEVEAAKSMLQLAVVAVIGGLIALLLREYEERRKASNARRDLLRNDLSDKLGAMYSRTKQIRRQLRAATDPNSKTLEYARYAELLEELSDVQLTFERLSHSAETGGRQQIVPPSVPTAVESMERYLGGLVTEYDTVVQPSNRAVALADRPKLADFTAKAFESDFKPRFGAPYRAAATAIEAVIEADLRQARDG